jgi:hypothetical protein
MNKLQILEQIVNDHQHMKLTTKVNGKNKKIIIDAFTASAILNVFRALNETNKEKFIILDWHKMVTITWKVLSK